MNKKLEEALKHLDAKRAKVFGWWDALENVELVAAAFPNLMPTVGLGYNVMSVQGILLHIYVHDMEKDVAPVLRALARMGHSKRGEPADYPELNRRHWSCDGDVQVLAFLYDDGDSVCEYVEVGTKEEKIYELQCTKKVAV